ISTWFARSATTAMIISAALPNVALRKPPSVGPDRLASSSVASPIKPAAGMSATAASTNTHIDSPRLAMNQLTGATSSRTFSQLSVKDLQSWRGIDINAADYFSLLPGRNPIHNHGNRRGSDSLSVFID